MIVQMKKVSLVVLEDTCKESLKKLRKLGLVHLEAVQGKGPVLASFKDAMAKTSLSLSILDEQKVPKKSAPVQIQISSDKEVLEKCKDIISLTEKKKSLLDGISNITMELERLSNWGSVNPKDFAFLAENGIYLYMFEIPSDKYTLLPKTVKTILVNTTEKISRFLVISEEELTERPKDLPAEAFEVVMPESSTDEMAKKIEKSSAEINEIESKILADLAYRSSIKKFNSVLSKDIEFENVYSGMGREEEPDVFTADIAQIEEEQSETVEEDDAIKEAKLAWLTGYVPVDCVQKLKDSCKQNEWALAITDPAEDDPVPTKLKNNKIVSMIYPLTDFLDVTPGYNEYDISGWFLLFFSIFFAMIFGDAGYGALITIVGILLCFKNKKNGSLNGLVVELGVCTMIWGAVTCTLFGLEVEKLPAWFVALSNKSPFVAHAVGSSDIANNNQKIFCFVLGLVQLSVAHIKGIIRYRKSPRFLGELGNLMELWGMFYVVMNMVVDSVKYPLGITDQTLYVFGNLGFYGLPLPFLCIGVLAVGFVLNFMFSNYNGSVGKSVLESCKNIISVLLGIVNVFSDTVSYIRLWAVALAGAAISSTVNTMAGPMFGNLLLILVAVILLVFGHGLNMILNLLSVIVHGVRLNTLEFSTHLGMTWSGTKYRPFSEN